MNKKTAPVSRGSLDLGDQDKDTLVLLLDDKCATEVFDPKLFSSYVDRMNQYQDVCDYVTFRELVGSIRSGAMERDTSFAHEGYSCLLKCLAAGDPEYMATKGVIFLATAFTYPEQFRVREYQPDLPQTEGGEEDFSDECMPETALILELNSGQGKRGRIYWWEGLDSLFPDDTYIPEKERVDFDGTWDECVDRFISLVAKMEEMAKDVMEGHPMQRTWPKESAH